MPFLVHSSPASVPWSEADDTAIMIAVREGDEDAFNELIRRKTPPLMKTVTRITRDREEARDVVQVVFLRVWEKSQSFDARWSPNTWIFRIAVNLAIDRVRWRQTREQALRPLGSHLRSLQRPGTRSIADLEDREVTEILERLAADLTEKQRLVFLLAGVERMGSEEVGQILGCKASTVRNHLFAARKHLREALTRKYPEYAPPSKNGPDRGGRL